MAVVLLAGCASPTPAPADRAVRANDTVSVDYIGTYPNGTVFDTSIESVAQGAGIYEPLRPYEPLEFTVGAGQMIQGFDEAVVGMKVNESKNIVIPPEKAYGNYDLTQIQPVPLKDLIDSNITPEINQTLYYFGQPVRVDSINNSSGQVFIDFNHPMAGKTLHFVITLRGIK
jgi:FKBP-type peptidyl-prolyl cis-trans isomerase 2